MKTIAFKNILTSIAILIALVSCNNNNSQLPPNHFRINGITNHNINKKDKMYYAYYFNGEWQLDSVQIRGNRFTIQDTLSYPTCMVMSDNMDELWYFAESGRNRNADCFIEPTTMNVEVSLINWNDFKLTGSQSQEDLVQFNYLMKPFWKAKANIYNNEYLDEEDISLGVDDVKKIQAAQMLQFIQKHPTSYVSLYHMWDVYVMADKQGKRVVDSIFTSMPKEMRENNIGRYLKRYIGFYNMAIGNTAPDFTMTDINSNIVSLKELRKNNKYILLDFWASWCNPSRCTSPMLTELYEKYHNKGVEIVSISIDQKEENWKEAVEKYGFGLWINTREAENSKEGKESIIDSYNVFCYPTLILIDKHGRIVDMWTYIKSGPYVKRTPESMDEILKQMQLIN